MATHVKIREEFIIYFFCSILPDTDKTIARFFSVIEP
jgi:hypothetical protein